ncbi:MAG: MTAP family purine nucleoside phosphorylase [Euryarchaeota archaeon]|nr:MTAP family purine nucleoside phosphorylase [Euryarchaeota archaeon]
MKIGIVSGHRIQNLIQNEETLKIETPYGDVTVQTAGLRNNEIFFLNRHGENSNIPPHKINYLANIQALASCHVDCIFVIGSVGSLKKNIKPGDFVIPHDFIDFTKSRRYTFFDDKKVHVDMTDPYCSYLRNILINTAKKTDSAKIFGKGIYLATEGPRLETVAEIGFFSKFADVVGMTGVPEVVLARERGICYASLCLVCNMAAGLQSELTANEISALYTEKEPVISKILKSTIESLDDKKRNCSCKDVLSKASL